MSLWCLHFRNKVSSTKMVCYCIPQSVFYFLARSAKYYFSYSLNTHLALSWEPKIPPRMTRLVLPLAQSWTSWLTSCMTCPFNIKWKFPCQNFSLLSKQCQHLTALWKYMMPNACLLSVWLLRMCSFICLLKSLMLLRILPCSEACLGKKNPPTPMTLWLA